MSSASPIDRVVRFCLEQKLVVFLIVLVTIGWGVRVAPFDWELDWLERDPVAVDAIPDLGENQQIVFTRWPGRSPQDVEDQITYPLTVALLGVPGVRTVRSSSMFGFSSIFVIFEEDVEFYWSRSRVLERLSSLGPGTLPTEVQPALGPDATALGQVFWYTLEGRGSEDGNPARRLGISRNSAVHPGLGRTLRYSLTSAEGVSGSGIRWADFVREYQVDVDPDAMRAFGVKLGRCRSRPCACPTLDVGARTIEVNKVEYVVRGLGFLESASKTSSRPSSRSCPTMCRSRSADLATVSIGPALTQRGALDKGGAEAVGGVVVVRYGCNPLAGHQRTSRLEIEEISPGLPSKAVIDWTRRTAPSSRSQPRSSLLRSTQAAWQDPPETLGNGLELGQVTLVPFYDRTGDLRDARDDALLVEFS